VIHPSEDPRPVAWHISSYSQGGGGNCVEAGACTGQTPRVAVRDSTRRAHGTLTTHRTAWSAFVTFARELT